MPIETWKGKGRGPFRADTPHGVGALANRPAPLGEREFYSADRFLILDGVQIPGNVGGLVRTAAALGVERVIALGDTADPLGPLAIRASAGFAAAIPILRTRDRGSVGPALASRGARMIAAVTSGGDWPPPRAKRWALVMGSEARGAGALPADAVRVTIPISPEVESLGVAAAGAILLSRLAG